MGKLNSPELEAIENKISEITSELREANEKRSNILIDLYTNETGLKVGDLVYMDGKGAKGVIDRFKVSFGSPRPVCFKLKKDGSVGKVYTDWFPYGFPIKVEDAV